MSVRLFTDKLVFRRLEVLGVWSLDSATPSESAYLAHASGSPGTQPNIDPCLMKDLDTTYCGACCWQKQLQVAWQCRMKGSGLSWAVCMEKGQANFEECLPGCAF